MASVLQYGSPLATVQVYLDLAVASSKNQADLTRFLSLANDTLERRFRDTEKVSDAPGMASLLQEFKSRVEQFRGMFTGMPESLSDLISNEQQPLNTRDLLGRRQHESRQLDAFDALRKAIMNNAQSSGRVDRLVSPSRPETGQHEERKLLQTFDQVFRS